MSAGDRSPSPSGEGLQSMLISAFGRVQASAPFRHPAGRRAFEVLYGAYKVLLEAGPVHHLRHYVRPGSLVVDAGANIGFFTVRFARWVGPTGRVIAVEPEAGNAERLAERLRRKSLDDRVEIVRAAATDRDGRTHLVMNPVHPGDHRIGDTGVDIDAVTVDRLVAGGGGRPVDLVKADVQGAEELVVAGAAGTIAEHRPALFVEIADSCLREFGSSGAQLVARITALGYEGHLLRRRSVGPPVPPEALSAPDRRGYVDVLFLPRR